jgi:hypothetical protein
MDVTKVTVALLYKGAIVRCVRKADAVKLGNQGRRGTESVSQHPMYTVQRVLTPSILFFLKGNES